MTLCNAVLFSNDIVIDNNCWSSSIQLYLFRFNVVVDAQTILLDHIDVAIRCCYYMSRLVVFRFRFTTPIVVHFSV